MIHRKLFWSFFLLSLSFILMMAGLAVSANAPPVIILDPGHGGRDGGAVGVSGVLEKDLNLDLAKKIAEQLERAGYQVVLTRTEDDDTDGQEGFYKRKDILARLALADKYPNCVFLSIHMNSSSSGSDKGFQVFYGKNHSRSRTLAESIYASVFQNAEVTRLREVKKAPDTVYLMKTLRVPAVLIECGFISNKADENLLSDPSYREKLAYVLYDGIVGYIERRTDLPAEDDAEDYLSVFSNILTTSSSHLSQALTH